MATADLTLREVRGLDPRLGLVEVSGLDIAVTTVSRLEPGDWPHAVALAQLAVGHQLVGASRAVLELARRHALERIQFGQPIADFQAVRHRLADTLVAVEAADALLGSAWDEGSPAAAASAKALAGRSASTARRHGQQVLAGIGFTTEHNSTTTCGGPWCSTSCSGPPSPSPGSSAGSCWSGGSCRLFPYSEG